MLEWIVSSTVLILGILILRRVLQGKISLRLQYALWLVVLVRLLCPLHFFQSDLSVQNALEAVLGENASHSVSDESQDIYHYEDDVPEPDAAQPQAPENAVFQSPVSENQPAASVNPPVQGTLASAGPDWPAILRILWLVGTLVMLSFTFGCNFQFSRMLARDRTKLEVPNVSVPVYVSSWVKTPCLVGVFRPVIYLTPEVGEDPSTWNHVIRHEMTHLEHFDHVFSLLRCLALCLHWFNPLVWIAARVSKEDAELACDEGTIARLGEGERIGYGETLIRLTCRSRNPSDLMITATTMIGTQSGIKERILCLAKKPKTLAYAMVIGLITLGLMVGCTFTGAAEDPEPSEPAQTIPTETTHPEETTLPPETTVPRETTLASAGFISLSRLIEDSDIRMTVDGKTITLSEDGLDVELSTDSLLVRRNGYIVAALKKMPRLIDGTIYVYEESWNDLFCADDGTPSLFRGMLFFADEVLEALEHPDDSAFNQKLLEEILLPVSMNIETPHIDVERVFVPTPLSEYPDALRNELAGLGYSNVDTVTYSEYLILSGAQTLAQAGISSDDETTVAEYTKQQQISSLQLFADGLSEEERDFAAQKQIELSDVSYLDRIFYGAYMDESDDSLKAALEAYYAADISYLESLSN